MATAKVKCLVIGMLATVCYLCSTSKSQDFSHCGLRSLSMRSRIIGGIQSRPGMWPWQVSIFKGNDNGNKEKQFICGGALVDGKWVVTTAHCFFKRSETSSRIRYKDDSSRPNKYTIVAGDYNIYRKDKAEQQRRVFKIHIYPGYRHAPFYENDIALIELNRTVSLGPSVRTVCLPGLDEKLSIPGAIASVAGWGRTLVYTRSPVLRHSAYQIQHDDLCDQATKYFFNRSVMFCAGSSKGGNDTCQGDSGGGLVRQVLHKGTQKYVAVGLVSWGEGCGLEGKYGYYTRMEPFVPWILNKITLKATCGNPGNIPNGRFTGKDFTEGSRVKYKCKRGYKLKGRSRRKCKANDHWSRAPVCQKVKCGKVSNPRNGKRAPAKDRYLYRDKVRFFCKTNFTRIGKSVIVCRHDARWSSFQAVCLDPCPDPGIPKGGSRVDHSFRHSDMVRFVCSNGWKMEGVGTIRCIKGRWNHSSPKCRRICGNPGRLDHGGFTGSEFFDGREIHFHCYRGFDLIGAQTARCLSTGRWSERRPICKRRCKKPLMPFSGSTSNPFHNQRQRTNYKHGTTIAFTCRRNYTLDGMQSIRCVDGRWNHTIPVCKAPCSEPVSPVNGTKIATDYRHGKRVDFTCQKGTRLVGESRLICNNGKWSSDVPVCRGSCVVPDKFTGVHFWPRVLAGEILQHNSTISFSCSNNKTLNGSKEIVCDNGKWSASFPKCQVSKTHCPSPGVPKNGFITSLLLTDTFTDGTSIAFSCNDTYTPQGHQIIECQNGQWNYDIPKCLASCKDPGTPENGIRYGSAFKHDDRLRFSCKTGKIMKGKSVIRCNDGYWDHGPPRCIGLIHKACQVFIPFSDIFCP